MTLGQISLLLAILGFGGVGVCILISAGVLPFIVYLSILCLFASWMCAW